MPNHVARPPERTWSPLDFDQQAFRAGASEKRFKRFARQGVRTLHAHVGGSGMADTVGLDEGPLLTMINCVLPRTARWRCDTDQALSMLCASRCCDAAFEVGSWVQLVFNHPEVTLLCLPDGAAGAFRSVRDRRRGPARTCAAARDESRSGVLERGAPGVCGIRSGSPRAAHRGLAGFRWARTFTSPARSPERARTAARCRQALPW